MLELDLVPSCPFTSRLRRKCANSTGVIFEEMLAFQRWERSALRSSFRIAIPFTELFWSCRPLPIHRRGSAGNGLTSCRFSRTASGIHGWSAITSTRSPRSALNRLVVRASRAFRKMSSTSSWRRPCLGCLVCLSPHNLRNIDFLRLWEHISATRGSERMSVSRKGVTGEGRSERSALSFFSPITLHARDSVDKPNH